MDYKPVVALDIDGTLGDYHGHFTAFAEQWTGRAMPPVSAMEPGVPFYRHLRMSKANYRQCKLAYRQGGMNRSMPVYEGAPELTREIRRAGAELWLCTTRPYMRHDNTHPDTKHWLRRHKFQYDYMVYGPKKYRDLIRMVPPGNIMAVLDDLPEMIEQARSLWLPTFVRDQPYNRCELPQTTRVCDFTQDMWRWELAYDIKKAVRDGKRMDNRRH